MHSGNSNGIVTYQESLGGNAQTAMLFTVSPSAVHLETTMSTLRYASTTRNIVNVATVNEDPKGRIIGYDGIGLGRIKRGREGPSKQLGLSEWYPWT